MVVGVIGCIQWRRDGVNLLDGGRVSGSRTAALRITDCSFEDQGHYSCYVFTAGGGEVSIPAELVVRCPAEFDGVEGIDGDDTIAFFALWGANDLAADVTGNGAVDGDDVVHFFERWDAGC